MNNVTSTISFGIVRNDPANLNLEAHRQRNDLLRSLASHDDLKVADWGNIDDGASHEYVEIILALGTAGAFTALVTAFREWLNSNKIQEVKLGSSDGKHTITLTRASVEDVVTIADAIGFKLPRDSIY